MSLVFCDWTHEDNNKGGGKPGNYEIMLWRTDAAVKYWTITLFTSSAVVLAKLLSPLSKETLGS